LGVKDEAVITVIEDEVHTEQHGTFETTGDAVMELERRARIPWDEAPNKCPCTSWRTCHRIYEIRKYDESKVPRKLLQSFRALEVSNAGTVWLTHFNLPSM